MDMQISLQAGISRRIEVAGRMFLIVDAGVAAALQLRFDIQGGDDEEISQAGKGFKARLPAGVFFRSIEMISTVDTTAKVVISNNDIDYSFTDGSTVKIANSGTPIQVSNDRGSPGNLLYVSGVSLSDSPATSLTSGAPVAVVPAGAVLAAANANRRGLRFLNLGPDPVAIGPAGMTWANRTVVLDVGDTWIEDRAANLAWSGITDVGKAASVTVQGVIA